MKIGVFQGCFPPDLNLEECMKLAKELGYDGFELSLECPTTVWSDPLVAGNQDVMDIGRSAGLGDPREGALTIEYTDKELEEVGIIADEVGIEVHSLASLGMFAYPLTSSHGRVADKGIEIAEKMIKAAAHLGSKSVLIMPGMVCADTPYDVAWKKSREAVGVLLQIAKKFNVQLAIENVWNKFLLSPLEMAKYIDGFNSDFIKVYFDVGNIVYCGYPEHWINILGNRISYVHLKGFKRDIGNISGFCNLLDGDVNWPAVMKALRNIGYDGYVTLEVAPYSHFGDLGVAHAMQIIHRLLNL